MREALIEAGGAFSDGEVPVGAVVVEGERIIGRGRNSTVRLSDPTAHAEIMAIRDAAEKKGNYRLSGADIYVTIEPCVMCAGAIVNARIGRLFYGAADPKGGAVDSLYKVLGDLRLSHKVEVTAGILEEETSKLMRRFFRGKRGEG